MTIAVLDTHTLVWFLQKDKKLAKRARQTILSPQVKKAIPFIVLCEIHYLHARSRFALNASQVKDSIEEVEGFEILPHTPEQLEHLQPQFEIHDALILACAYEIQEKTQQPIIILTKDSMLHQQKDIKVVWS